MSTKMKFPRNLYAKGGDLKLKSGKETYTYSTILVEDKEAYDNAIEAGYVDDFTEVITGKVAADREKASEIVIEEVKTEKKKNIFSSLAKKEADDDDF